MPEEINRILADHSSTYLFAPTQKSRQILINEGINEENIFVTGNTIVDAVLQNIELCKRKKNVLNNLHLESGDYILVTAHRQENVDDEARFRGIIEELEKTRELGLEIIYPIHPRARKNLNKFRLELTCVRVIEPLDYLSFLQLESNARLVLTDSGGVQEEACILGVPCVTLRDNTERPETSDVEANVLAGSNPCDIVGKAKLMLNRLGRWENPFGDGTVGEQIIQLLMKEFA